MKFSEKFYHTPPPENQDIILNFFYYFEEKQNSILCRKIVTIPQCIDIFPSVGDSLLVFSVLCCFSFSYEVLYAISHPGKLYKHHLL